MTAITSQQKMKKTIKDHIEQNGFHMLMILVEGTLQPGFTVEKSESKDNLVGGNDIIIKIKKLAR